MTPENFWAEIKKAGECNRPDGYSLKTYDVWVAGRSERKWLVGPYLALKDVQGQLLSNDELRKDLIEIGITFGGRETDISSHKLFADLQAKKIAQSRGGTSKDNRTQTTKSSKQDLKGGFGTEDRQKLSKFYDDAKPEANHVIQNLVPATLLGCKECASREQKEHRCRMGVLEDIKAPCVLLAAALHRRYISPVERLLIRDTSDKLDELGKSDELRILKGELPKIIETLYPSTSVFAPVGKIGGVVAMEIVRQLQEQRKGSKT
jgi:hypothetical protein